MSLRLYFMDCYLQKFEGTVLEVEAGVRLYLDQTAFYPTSGGQPFDRGYFEILGDLAGTAERLSVVDVVDEGDRIAHVLDKGCTLAPGTRLRGHIDWERRWDHMQQHSGQHLLSAVFEQVLGRKTVSVHFGAVSSTLDLDGPPPTLEELERVEERANERVMAALSVGISMEDGAAAATLRTPTSRQGEIRIITIADLDRSACGGTHVRRTSEVGLVALRRTERVRKCTRVEFLCGLRALRSVRREHRLLMDLAGTLSASSDDVLVQVQANLDELKSTRQALKSARLELSAYQAERAYLASTITAQGFRLHTHESTPPPHGEDPLASLRSFAQAFAGKPKAVLLATLAETSTLLIAAAPDTGLDAAGLLKAALSSVGGRGGGTAHIAQGTAPTAEGLSHALTHLKRLL